MNLDLDDLKHILTLVREHGVSELEIEREGWRLKVRHGMPAPSASALAQLPSMLRVAPTAGPQMGPTVGAHHGGTTAVPVAVAASTTSDETDKVLQSMTVSDALRQLSHSHREILIETYFRGRTVPEAAEALNLPLGTAKSRVYYALRALRTALQQRGVTE